MPKNIVICCDGTGNQLNEAYSNVVKLYICLKKSPNVQLAFYDPGVGTLSNESLVNPISKKIFKLGGLAFGWGLKENVNEAYGYLMDYYEKGDKIFLFGFSRGAYTVRVLAGLIHAIGLLEKGCQNLFPYAWEIFGKCFQEDKKKIAAQFKLTYARDVDIHFVGVWDTVTSIGIFNRRKLPFTTQNSSIRNIRHAVAIDEFRTYYRQNLFIPMRDQNIKQVWFAGAHSDVGGSYPLNESGLSQLALEWMIREAKQFDLLVDNDKYVEQLDDGLRQGLSKPDYHEPVHKSLSSWWYIFEIIPKRQRNGFPIILPLGRPRKLSQDMFGEPLVPTLHNSVLQKLNDDGYRPKNLPPSGKFNIEN